MGWLLLVVFLIGLFWGPIVWVCSWALFLWVFRKVMQRGWRGE